LRALVSNSGATDPARLAEERTKLQDMVAVSPLMDGRRFARALENALHEMHAEVVQHGQQM